METSSRSSRPESGVERTIFFALIFYCYEESTFSVKPIFPPVSDPAFRWEGVLFPQGFWVVNGCL